MSSYEENTSPPTTISLLVMSCMTQESASPTRNRSACTSGGVRGLDSSMHVVVDSDNDTLVVSINQIVACCYLPRVVIACCTCSSCSSQCFPSNIFSMAQPIVTSKIPKSPASALDDRYLDSYNLLVV